MRLRGKRCLYDVEGKRLSVENAWSCSLWAQERVVLEGTVLRAAGGYLTTDRSFTLPVRETGFEDPLHVTLYSGLFGIKCLAVLGETRLAPVAVQFATWDEDKGGWPRAERAGV